MMNEASKLKKAMENKTLKTDVAKRYVHERPKPAGTAPSSRPTSGDSQPAQPVSSDTPVQEQPHQSTSDNQSEAPNSNSAD